jgi:hypothetical protein
MAGETMSAIAAMPPAGRATRAYAIFAGAFLLLQGASTLTARLVPEVDRALPWLLDITQMVPVHSSLHLATAALAFASLAVGRTRLFALAFGVFYAGLGVIGWISGQGFCLSLQPFDHPFHIVLGGLGLAAAAIEIISNGAAHD